MPQNAKLIAVIDVISTPKRVVGSCFFMMKLVVFMLRESKRLKDGSFDTL